VVCIDSELQRPKRSRPQWYRRTARDWCGADATRSQAALVAWVGLELPNAL
jgi:hypothetical protein